MCAVMTLDEYLNQPNAPTGVKLAAALKVPPSLLSQWRSSVRPVPAERCLEIERACEGAVTCEELRPDVDWRRHRDLNDQREAA